MIPQSSTLCQQTNNNRELQVTVSIMLFSLIVILPTIPALAYAIHKIGG